MASGSNLWKCSSCGYENTEFDSKCFLCGKSKPTLSSPDEQKQTSSSNTNLILHDHMTTSHYVIMGLLLLGIVFFCSLTPAGQKLVGSIHISLIMNFSTLTVERILNDWQGFLELLLVIGAIGGGIWGEVEFDSFGGGAIGGLILGGICYFVICLVWVVLVNYVFPFVVNVGTFVAVCAISLALALGCSVAIVNYIKYFILYLDPYPKKPGVYQDDKRVYYEDKSKNREEYGKRSYFFGPGYFSIKETINSSWRANFQLIENVREWLGDHTDSFWDWLCWIPGVPYFLFFALSILVVGSIVTLICSLIHGFTVLLFMMVIYIIFSIVWLLDRLVLMGRKRRKTISVCGACKESYLIPMFVCPNCGMRHRHLVPGVYGILYHQCTCKYKLPSTFLTGRTNLTACCPHCSTDSYIQRLENDVYPISLQLVGGISSGKSVYLASALTRIQENLAVRSDTVVTPSDENLMKDLRRMYTTGSNTNTTETNAIMYSLRVHSSSFTPDRLLSIFDIAGEFFTRPESAKVPQLQLRNVDGIVMLIDVLSLYKTEEMKALDIQTSSHRSMARNVDVLNGLVEHMELVGTKRRNGLFKMPFHVVISKLDTVNELLQKIKIDDSLMDLMMTFMPAGDYPATVAERDKICHDFIRNRDEVNLLALIENNFSTVHYYATSASGGEMVRGRSLHPWPGMLLPIYDTVEKADVELFGLLKKGGLN